MINNGNYSYCIALFIDSKVFVPHVAADEYTHPWDKSCFTILENSVITLMQYYDRKNIEVVVTDVMKKVHGKIISGETVNLLLMGPQGIGKTTTIYWLYWQFARNPMYEVHAVPLACKEIQEVKQNILTSTNKKLLLLCDLNTIQSYSSDVISSLIDCMCVIRDKNGSSVFAASSSFRFSVQLGSRDTRSILRRLTRFMVMEIIRPDRSAAKELIQQIQPGSDSGRCYQLLMDLKYNFLCVLLGCMSSNSYFDEEMRSLSCDLMEDIFKTDIPARWSVTRKALRHSLPISCFELTERMVAGLVPLLTYIVEIDEDSMIPQLLLPLPLFELDLCISNFSQKIPSSDEASTVVNRYPWLMSAQKHT